MWGTDPLKSKRECLTIRSYKFITLFAVLCSSSVIHFLYLIFYTYLYRYLMIRINKDK